MRNTSFLGSEITSPSTLDVVSIDQIRDFLRVDEDAADNGLLSLMRDAAKGCAESYTNRILLSSTAKAYYSDFEDIFYLPYGKVTAIQSVKYYDSDNNLQTVSSTNYTLVSHGALGAYVVIDSDYNFPSLGDNPIPVQITFTAGYSSADDIPPAIILGILNLCSDFYDNRSMMDNWRLSDKLKMIFNPYKIFSM
jgi:uncharacterized phiE125 gp8 family phage protein